jgi:hypothetical protein
VLQAVQSGRGIQDHTEQSGDFHSNSLDARFDLQAKRALLDVTLSTRH